MRGFRLRPFPTHAQDPREIEDWWLSLYAQLQHQFNEAHADLFVDTSQITWTYNQSTGQYTAVISVSGGSGGGGGLGSTTAEELLALLADEDDGVFEDSPTITWQYDSSEDLLYAHVVSHDVLPDYDPLEHIDWTNATQDLLTTGNAQVNGLNTTSSAIFGNGAYVNGVFVQNGLTTVNDLVSQLIRQQANSSAPTTGRNIVFATAGAGDAGKVVGLNASGLVDSSMYPHTHTLASGATDVTATASEINQALDGIGPSVTASNLTLVTDGSNADGLHVHAVGGAPTSVTFVDTSTIDITPQSGAGPFSINVIQSGLDHGSISGLDGDDHLQYHNDTRGDARYYTKTLLDAGQLDNRYYRENEHLNASAGPVDSGKPIVLAADGKISPTMYNQGFSIGNVDASTFIEFVPLGAYTTAAVASYSADFGAVIFADQTAMLIGNVTLAGGPYGPLADLQILNGIPAKVRPTNERDFFVSLKTREQGVPPGRGPITGSVYSGGTLFVHTDSTQQLNSLGGVIGDIVLFDCARYPLVDFATELPEPYVFPNGITIGDTPDDITIYGQASFDALVSAAVINAVATSITTQQITINDFSLGSLDDFEELAQDAVGNALADSTTINFVYVDEGPPADTITANVIAGGVDHGELAGLTGDDHLHYHTDLRGDVRYYRKNQHVQSGPVVSAPVITGASGVIVPSLVPDHNDLNGYEANRHIDWTDEPEGSTFDFYGGNITAASDLVVEGKAYMSSTLAVASSITVGVSSTTVITPSSVIVTASVPVIAALTPSGTGGAQLDADYGWILKPDNTNWIDVRVPITLAKLGLLNDPTWRKLADNNLGAPNTSPGIWSYAFGTAKNEELFFLAQLDHGYVEGSNIFPHAHIQTIGATTGVVHIGLEYVWINVGDAMPAATSTIYGTKSIAAATDTHQVIPVGPVGGLVGTGMKISSHLICRFFRYPKTAGWGPTTQDTYAGEIALLEFDFHIQVNTAGSREAFIK